MSSYSPQASAAQQMSGTLKSNFIKVDSLLNPIGFQGKPPSFQRGFVTRNAENGFVEMVNSVPTLSLLRL